MAFDVNIYGGNNIITPWLKMSLFRKNCQRLNKLILYQEGSVVCGSLMMRLGGSGPAYRHVMQGVVWGHLVLRGWQYCPPSPPLPSHHSFIPPPPLPTPHYCTSPAWPIWLLSNITLFWAPTPFLPLLRRLTGHARFCQLIRIRFSESSAASSCCIN